MKAAISRSVYLENQLLATLVPQSPYFKCRRRRIAPQSKYVLSRFAYLHKEEDQIVLESPLSYARVVLHHWMASAFVHLLAVPVSIREMRHTIPGLTETAKAKLMNLLLGTSMLTEVAAEGIPVEDYVRRLQTWEFHDLLFHARSRAGRHDRAAGGTHRFDGILDPPPPVKQMAGETPLQLYKPDLNQLQNQDPPFVVVQEERCSIRKYGQKAITAQQLGEFLFRVARVSKNSETAHNGQEQTRTACRPYPSAGALYELELYVLIQRCKNVRPGFYYYEPERHHLIKISDSINETQQLLSDAGKATTIEPSHMQTLIVVSARFQRIAWKYSAIAYSLILKNVGVLMQTMYLAATAMGLAPCAVGYGNSELFTRVAGTQYETETSVGEFLLGSKPR